MHIHVIELCLMYLHHERQVVMKIKKISKPPISPSHLNELRNGLESLTANHVYLWGVGGEGEEVDLHMHNYFINSHKSDLSQNCKLSTTLIINLNKGSNSSTFPIEHST